MEDNFAVANALSGIFYIATTEGDQPHVRPFDGATIIDNHFYIGTERQKNVFKQIKNNPKVEIFSMEQGLVRFTAEAFPVDDDEINKDVYAALGKEFDSNSVAIELKNAKGTYQDAMGEKTDFSF